MECPPPLGTQAGDVYSFAIVLSEILSRDVPFGSFNKMPQEIVNLVRAGLDPPFRPELTNNHDADVDPGLTTLMKDCWLEDPKMRPDFKKIKAAIKQMNRSQSVA